ncbi:hypothetical protein [Burkholderia pseudomallei]|uniref:hypothetical protein n=1 Tax=Burkholderia pseudomallei TaxID=28450 RepID=UPI001F2E585B|nr:hypothetical protein [Burkholderia pseudomallei]
MPRRIIRTAARGGSNAGRFVSVVIVRRTMRFATCGAPRGAIAAAGARRLPGVSRIGIVAAPVARVRARCRQAGAPRRKPRAAMAAPNARSPAISTLERPFSRCRKGLELR